MKKGERERQCGKQEMHIKFWFGNPWRIGRVGNKGTDGRIILK